MGRFLFWGFWNRLKAALFARGSPFVQPLSLLRSQLPRQRHTLSVTFGDTSFAAALPSQALRASSPKGGATGVPGHFPLDA